MVADPQPRFAAFGCAGLAICNRRVRARRDRSCGQDSAAEIAAGGDLGTYWNFVCGCAGVAQQLGQRAGFAGIAGGDAVDGSIAGGAHGRPRVGRVAGVAGRGNRRNGAAGFAGLSFAVTQWAGGAAALGAAVLIAVSVLWMKRELAAVSVVWLAGIQLASAAVVVGIWSFIVEGRSGFDWDRKLVWTEAALAVAGSAMALPLYYWLLRGMESFQMTATQWLVTVVGVSEGLLLLREAPGWRLVAGAGILVASLTALLRTRASEETPVTLTLTGGFS